MIWHEILAGLSTFFTMSYILILLPELLSAGGFEFGAALTATAVTLACSTLFLACYAHFPMVVGPGIGIAAFLMFSVVDKHIATLAQVLGLVFWGGVIVFLLSITGLRQKILHQIPRALKKAAPVGIGLFFIVIGAKQIAAAGREEQLIALFGIILFILLYFRVPRFAFILPILVCWGLALQLNVVEWQGLFSLPPALTPIQLDLAAMIHPELWGSFLSLLLIVLFDAGAALTALARLLSWDPIPRLHRALLPDGIGSMLGALLGTTSCTFYAESGSGIRAGGRGGIVGGTVACCTLLVLFFYPALSSIPLFAAAPALIGLGGLLASDQEWFAWRDLSEWIPFLVTALTMPLFFNIYLGFAFGFMSYVIIKLLMGRYREIRGVVWGLAVVFSIQLLFL
jgi:adenine/guanine/hypoxanthine permease